MDAQEEIVDSPVGWVNKHIKQYVDSGGTEGHRFQGQQTLLLTVRGRKSGVLRRTALIYARDGERYVVVGSNGGKDGHPAWYLNVLAEPSVLVQVGTESFAARACPAAAEERERLWQLLVTMFPSYKGMQKKTDRVLPVVVIEPAA
ncbi:nitroreductase family deazaflavin-dependent oxidoreductase [Streptomyces griseus]|uniref:nitroreductase family deazaflavin-dependent oxidoreductase n=1 Tax=Streptomyces griseus TaxID=1911 RepID=UPI0005632ADB|nr:nitroreductase family deazaflavin-dependent oxidoreductase [Streptomyces griseus]